MIKQSILENLFPTALKSAIITPICKAGDKQEISNYRQSQYSSHSVESSRSVPALVPDQLVEHLETANHSAVTA